MCRISVGRGRALVGADREQPQGALRHQVGGVGGDALVEPVEVLGDAAPGEVEIGRVAVPAGDLPADHVKRGIVDRRVGDSVLADHLGGHALADLREVAGIGEQAQVGMRVHVDESRREHVPGSRVDGLVGARNRSGARDFGDPAVVDRDVRPVPGRAGAVDDVDVSDQ